MKKITWMVLGGLVLSVSVQAASFDCSKASTNVEKIICNNNLISSLDDEMDLAYLRALERTDDRHKVQQEQQQWLKDVRNACPTEGPCLLKVYNSRIEELNDIPTHKCYWLEPPQKHDGKRPEVEPICKVMEENLNQFCDQPPMACGLKIAPQFSQQITFPAWAPVDKDVNPTLIEEFLRAYWKNRSTGGAEQRGWEEIHRPEMEAAFAENRLTFSKAKLDLYSLGRVHTAYRLDYGNCQVNNPQLKDKKTWNAPIKSAPVQIQYGPEVISPLFKEYPPLGVDTLRGDVFLYAGKVYTHFMNGNIDQKSGLRENWFVVNRYGRRTFSDNKSNLMMENICVFNYQPVSGVEK